MTMDARKQRVLQAIVALYGLEGEPVGSSVLANYFDMAVSSATLRNEMAALTKLGLLEQPHTSAGRVPSAKGYRYYLDNLLTDDQPLDRVTRARVDAVFASLDHEPEKLAQGAARALAAISGCTAAVSTPCAEDLCIAHYEVVQVGRSAAAVLAVTTAGYVRTRVARVRSGLSREKAAALAALLNHSLTFVAPVDLSGRMLAELCSQIDPELVPVISAAAAATASRRRNTRLVFPRRNPAAPLPPFPNCSAWSISLSSIFPILSDICISFIFLSPLRFRFRPRLSPGSDFAASPGITAAAHSHTLR